MLVWPLKCYTLDWRVRSSIHMHWKDRIPTLTKPHLSLPFIIHDCLGQLRRACLTPSPFPTTNSAMLPYIRLVSMVWCTGKEPLLLFCCLTWPTAASATYLRLWATCTAMHTCQLPLNMSTTLVDTLFSRHVICSRQVACISYIPRLDDATYQ